MDWETAGNALELRIGTLGAKYAAIAAAADVNQSSLWKARKGRGDELSPELLARIDRAVHWPEGTITRIAAGGQPPPAVETPDDRISRIERELAAVRDDLAVYIDKLDRLLSPETDHQ